MVKKRLIVRPHAAKRLAVSFVVLALVCAIVLSVPGKITHAQTVKIRIAAGQDASTVPMHDMINAGLASKALGFDVEWDEFPYDDLHTKLINNGQSKNSDFDLL